MDSEQVENRKAGIKEKKKKEAVKIETNSTEVEAEVWVFLFEALGNRQNFWKQQYSKSDI